MIELFKELNFEIPKYYIKEKYYVSANENEIRIFGDKYEPPNLFIEK